MKKRKEKRDHLSFKEGMTELKTSAADFSILFKEWITDYGRVFLPIVLLICVLVTFFVAFNARSRVEAAAREAEEALLESKTEVVEIVEAELETDIDPEIIAMFQNYYVALGNADIEAIKAIQGTVSDTEKLRLQAMGPYIEKYDNVQVYYKPGPYIDTYITYVSVDVYLKESEIATPGLQAFYVCRKEDGTYYINSSELSAEEAAYIEDVAAQADVINLRNTINVQYTELMDENEDLKEYWAQISVEIDSFVGETLTEEAVLQAKLEAEEEKRLQEERENDPDYQPEEEEEPVIRQVKTTEKVNVRKSASATADRVGTASEGAVYTVVEEMLNGWTKILYEGKEAFIKSEFLVDVEDASEFVTTSYIYATSSLNVRSSPSKTAERVGVLSTGDTVELIEEADGWCKIKYNGTVAYVKSEFTEKK